MIKIAKDNGRNGFLEYNVLSSGIGLFKDDNKTIRIPKTYSNKIMEVFSPKKEKIVNFSGANRLTKFLMKRGLISIKITYDYKEGKIQ